MKLVIKLVVLVAVALGLYIAWINYDSRRQEEQERAASEAAEAMFLEMLQDESQHSIPDTAKLEEPQAADLEWRLERLGGDSLSLAELRGKTIFIDTWATWCKPCIAQMPSIQRLQDQFPNEDVAFLLVTADDREKVETYVEEEGVTVPVYFSAKEPESETFHLSPLPSTYVISPAGELVYKEHGGPKKYDDPSFVEFLGRWSVAEDPELAAATD